MNRSGAHELASSTEDFRAMLQRTVAALNACSPAIRTPSTVCGRTRVM
jgi:hypothetical protein